jgi:hypothetical protein
VVVVNSKLPFIVKSSDKFPPEVLAGFPNGSKGKSILNPEEKLEVGIDSLFSNGTTSPEIKYKSVVEISRLNFLISPPSELFNGNCV